MTAFLSGRAHQVLALAAILTAVFLVTHSPVHPQAKPSPKAGPRLEPIAETRLLMEGLAHANFRGLERKLTARPAEDQDWVFARGQALLIAETANLLMLRPPKKEGQDIWFTRATEMRTRATFLAQVLAAKNYEHARTRLLDLAATCNSCHKSFRVPVVIEAFEAAPMMTE